jgi:hypothetical protein
MSCIFFDASSGRHCDKVTMLGSFYCADHARSRRSSSDYRMKLPPPIPDRALPTAHIRPPTAEEAGLFAKAASTALGDVRAMLSALGERKDSDSRQKAETALHKVFGAIHASQATQTLENMAWILNNWAMSPQEGLSMSDANAFLGWQAGTSAHGTGRFLTWTWTAASIKLPRVTKEGIDTLSRTLIHESAHGVSSDIQDGFGYRTKNPGKFYRSTCQQRLINADHYAQCVEMFKGRLTSATWDQESQEHSGIDGGGKTVASRLSSIFIDLQTLCLHAKITGDRMVQWLAGKGNEPYGEGAKEFGQLVGRTYNDTTTRGVALARMVDVMHQLRRLEDALDGVDFGDGHVVDLDDLFKENKIAQKGSAAIVYPINVSNVKVMVIATPGTPDRDLRGLLLKEMISECLQSHNPGDAGRVITAENLYSLHSRYAQNAKIPPIDVNLSPAIARHVDD